MKHFLLCMACLATLSAPVANILPDSLDYSKEFWEINRRATEMAKKEMPWASAVPEREWKNFVEPVRVNNELLDTSRIVFFRELAPRVKNLSMTDAALEVNHWCHEKVTYRPSDARTSSPLATLKTSWGRCGEESTFAVAALRSVGIPARQVYTPRWAHTDDNHAWVEVWTDGKWHFLGACEPEPLLDLAWFNAPAARGMLMNTRVRNGNYDGPEEVLDRNDYITTINVTANYAPVDTVHVTVIGPDGKPVENATVLFTIYNYAEFYPIARKLSDRYGKALLTAGRGDMLVWAYNADGNFGFSQYEAGKSGNNITVSLDMDKQSTMSRDLKLTPPKPGGHAPQPTKQQLAKNNVRKQAEDSIRNAYMSTFITLEEGEKIARNANFPEPEKVARMLRDSYGNHNTILNFLRSADNKKKAVDLLSAISDKDLRDISTEILADHYATPLQNTSLFADYIMNPRVASENLTAYRAFFSQAISADSAKLYRRQPQQLVDWVRNNIGISTKANPENLYISPISVWNHRKDINPRSRNVFFVCVARTVGIPARIDPVTAKPQWADRSGKWIDAMFEAEKTNQPTQGIVKLTYDGTGVYTDPKYYYHFSISKIENGMPQLLEYDENDCTWSNTFKDGYKLDCGQYLLVSGQRLAGGGVLANMNLFSVKPNSTTTIPLKMLTDKSEPQVIGSFNSENLYADENGNVQSLLAACGRGYYALGIIRPAHEPSYHALHELASQAVDVEKWGIKVVLLAESADELKKFPAELISSLPSNVIVGAMTDSTIKDELSADNLPTFIIADTFNRIVFRTDGYTINLPNAILEIIKKL